jgi:hypothetical protein
MGALKTKLSPASITGCRPRTPKLVLLRFLPVDKKEKHVLVVCNL